MAKVGSWNRKANASKLRGWGLSFLGSSISPGKRWLSVANKSMIRSGLGAFGCACAWVQRYARRQERMYEAESCRCSPHAGLPCRPASPCHNSVICLLEVNSTACSCECPSPRPCPGLIPYEGQVYSDGRPPTCSVSVYLRVS